MVVVLFWLDLWEIFFLPTPGFELGTSGYSNPALNHWVPGSLLLFTSANLQVFSSGAEGLVVVSFWLDLWEIFILPTPELWAGELWISSPALYHWWHWWLVVFTSDNFSYLNLVQRDWWWYCSDWTCERFSFCPHQGLNWGPLDP